MNGNTELNLTFGELRALVYIYTLRKELVMTGGGCGSDTRWVVCFRIRDQHFTLRGDAAEALLELLDPKH